VLGASTKSKKHDPRGVELSNRDLVAKIYWPEESRINEATAIEHAHNLLKNSVFKQHLPIVICWKDFNHRTGDIRQKLGITDDNTKSRVLRVLIAIRLEQLGYLRDEGNFLNGWKGCFQCRCSVPCLSQPSLTGYAGHHELWLKGIQHGDISLWNLMWDPSRNVGVLNDFDLVQISGESFEGGRRTGTIAFMALDLLALEEVSRRYTRFYRHDVESLIWVLIWVCLSLEYNDDIPPSLHGPALHRQRDRLESWKNPLSSLSTRLKVLTFTYQFEASNSYRRLWNLATQFIKCLNSWRGNRAKPVDDADDTEDTYSQIMELVKNYEESA